MCMNYTSINTLVRLKVDNGQAEVVGKCGLSLLSSRSQYGGDIVK